MNEINKDEAPEHKIAYVQGFLLGIRFYLPTEKMQNKATQYADLLEEVRQALYKRGAQ